MTSRRNSSSSKFLNVLFSLEFRLNSKVNGLCSFDTVSLDSLGSFTGCPLCLEHSRMFSLFLQFAQPGHCLAKVSNLCRLPYLVVVTSLLLLWRHLQFFSCYLSYNSHISVFIFHEGRWSANHPSSSCLNV